MAFLLGRLTIIRMILAGSLVFLMIRVGYLSLYMGETLAEECVEAHLICAELGYERGELYDRNGVRITNRTESSYVAVFPSDIDDRETAISYLAELTIRSENELERMLEKRAPFCLSVKNISEQALRVNGIVVFRKNDRYDARMKVSHVLGYVQENGRVGIGGVEQMCDAMLRGEGKEYVQVVTDGAGHIIRGAPYRMSNDREKKRVTLTLDWKLQKAIEEVMDKHRVHGAVVVMRVDGDVLAMVSRPTFRMGELTDHLTAMDAPFLNRAVHPVALGSVFKVVTAMAGLASGEVTMRDKWEDAGRIEVAGITFHGWDDQEGYISRELTLTEAMAHSSNSVFIQVGTKIGGACLVDMARRVGFGEQTIAGYYGEETGNLPREPLYIGEVANLAIGQGELLATPMQVTKMMAIVANGGYDVMPRLLLNAKKDPQHRILDARVVRDVQNMLASAVDDGTGQAAQTKRGQVSGKTGSAETGRKTSDGKSINHAWFSGYFPRQAPHYVCTVMIEEGKSGGGVAAPIFREIMEIIQ
ncbi:MAG: penicillin-binding protein 2 [Selenomonadales bacterium]|nr:penicillin-binding protein 2 [Selenomonadales bacterium]